MWVFLTVAAEDQHVCHLLRRWAEDQTAFRPFLSFRSAPKLGEPTTHREGAEEPSTFGIPRACIPKRISTIFPCRKPRRFQSRAWGSCCCTVTHERLLL